MCFLIKKKQFRQTDFFRKVIQEPEGHNGKALSPLVWGGTEETTLRILNYTEVHKRLLEGARL